MNYPKATLAAVVIATPLLVAPPRSLKAASIEVSGGRSDNIYKNHEARSDSFIGSRLLIEAVENDLDKHGLAAAARMHAKTEQANHTEVDLYTNAASSYSKVRYQQLNVSLHYHNQASFERQRYSQYTPTVGWQFVRHLDDSDLGLAATFAQHVFPRPIETRLNRHDMFRRRHRPDYTSVKLATALRLFDDAAFTSHTVIELAIDNHFFISKPATYPSGRVKEGSKAREGLITLTSGRALPTGSVYCAPAFGIGYNFDYTRGSEDYALVKAAGECGLRQRILTVTNEASVSYQQFRTKQTLLSSSRPNTKLRILSWSNVFTTSYVFRASLTLGGQLSLEKTLSSYAYDHYSLQEARLFLSQSF